MTLHLPCRQRHYPAGDILDALTFGSNVTAGTSFRDLKADDSGETMSALLSAPKTIVFGRIAWKTLKRPP